MERRVKGASGSYPGSGERIGWMEGVERARRMPAKGWTTWFCARIVGRCPTKRRRRMMRVSPALLAGSHSRSRGCGLSSGCLVFIASSKRESTLDRYQMATSLRTRLCLSDWQVLSIATHTSLTIYENHRGLSFLLPHVPSIYFFYLTNSHC